MIEKSFVLMIRLGQLQEAVQSYTAAIELDPSFTEAYIGRGNVYTEFLTEGGNQKARYI